jgi:opacity protein-like surface antigen
MRSGSRGRYISFLTVFVSLAAAAPAAAQFGIGPRIAMVRTDVGADNDSVRFTGGQVRLTSQRTGFEVSFDRRSESFDLLNEKVKETPVQASLLLYLAKGAFAPYLLGGPGWYTRTVEPIDDPTDTIESVSTRKFGWHAGFGAEIKMGRHAGLHGDYRYTFLSFNDDDEENAGATSNDSFISGLLPSHEGSMWTVGFTIYF